MGCNYEYPVGECTDEPPTTEPPTTEPEDPPSSEEVAILEQQVEDLTVNKIKNSLSFVLRNTSDFQTISTYSSELS